MVRISKTYIKTHPRILNIINGNLFIQAATEVDKRGAYSAVAGNEDGGGHDSVSGNNRK